MPRQLSQQSHFESSCELAIQTNCHQRNMNELIYLSTVVFTPGTLEISFYPSSPLLYLSFVGTRVVPTCVSWCFQAAATLANLMWAPDLNQEHLVGHLDHPGGNVSQIFGR